MGTNASVFPTGAVFLSADGGASWEPKGLNVVSQIWIDPSQPDTIYADDNLGFSRSLNGGDSWQRLNLPGPSTSPFAFVLGSDGTAYAWFGSGKLFRSANRGDSWTPASSLPLPFTELRRREPDGQPSGGIVADPGTSTVWAMTTSGLFRSSDRGASWESRGAGSALSLAIDPTNSAVLYAGSRGGVWKSVDAGQNWKPVGVGSPFSDTASVLSLAVDPQTPTIVYAGTFNNAGDFSQGLLRSEDGGASWNRSDRGLPGVPVFALIADSASPTTVYAAVNSTGSGTIYKTRDAGGSWEKTGPADIPNVTALAIDPVAPATLYVGSGVCPFRSSWQCEGDVRKTTDGGASWSTLIKYGGIAALAVDPHRSSTVFLSAFCINLDLGPCSGPLKSDDGGSSWENLTHPSGMLAQFLFDPAAPNEAYVLSLSLCPSCFQHTSITSTAFRTLDGGASWSAASSGLPGSGAGATISVSRLVPDAKSPGTVYAATQQGLFRTTDAGVSWRVTGLTVRVLGVAIEPWDSDVLYAATDGSGVLQSVDRGVIWTPINTGLPNLSVQALVIDSAGTYLHATTSVGGVYDLPLPRRIDSVGPPQQVRTVKPRV